MTFETLYLYEATLPWGRQRDEEKLVVKRNSDEGGKL